MASVWRSVVRGDHVFAVDVSATSRGRSVTRISVNRGTTRLGEGALELFPASYLRSWRYRIRYGRLPVGPVGRIGPVLIGPDAAKALGSAIAEACLQLARIT